MELMSIKIICILAIVLCVVAIEDSDIATKKLAILKNSALSAASAIRNVTIKDSQGKVQIASMASDFMLALNYVKYAVGSAVPNVPLKGSFIEIALTYQKISGLAHDIQHAFAGDSEALKDKLALSLEQINKAITDFEQKPKKSTNFFADNQLNRKNDAIIYAISKLHYQAKYFDLKNSELAPLIESSFEQFIKVVGTLSVFNKSTKSQLIHIFQHLAILTERNTYKFENWIELNASSKQLKLVQDASKNFGQLYENLVTVSSGTHTALYLKLKLKTLVISGFGQAGTLTALEYPENLGGQEFIRSFLFDGVTVGRVYTDNIKILV